MPDTPLNQDALTRRDIMAGLIGAWIDEWDDGKADTGHVATHIANRLAENGVTTLAVAQPEVTSVEELDQLPIGSLIMMSGVVAPFLHTDDGWESTRTPGKPVWDYTTNPSYLPARVLYRPTKEATNGSK